MQKHQEKYAKKNEKEIVLPKTKAVGNWCFSNKFGGRGAKELPNLGNQITCNDHGGVQHAVEALKRSEGDRGENLRKNALLGSKD